MFKNAIVRKPGRSSKNGQSSANQGSPDYEKMMNQHQKYIDALIKCGLEVSILKAEEDFPDSTFVEDTAVVTEKCGIMCFPGHSSRQGEEHSIEPTLAKFRKIENIEFPGTVDGGDILRAEDHFYIGLSDRTNLQGAEQLSEILQKYGYTASTVPVKDILHLKSGINYLDNNKLLIMEACKDWKEFRSYDKITVPEDESYAANCLIVNQFVLTPLGFPEVKKKLLDNGYQIIELDMSEFAKLDGGLSCLSLRF